MLSRDEQSGEPLTDILGVRRSLELKCLRKLPFLQLETLLKWSLSLTTRLERGTADTHADILLVIPSWWNYFPSQ